jgi:hypothetical protein
MITTMTDNVSVEVNHSMADKYKIMLDGCRKSKQSQFHKYAIFLSNDPALLEDLEKNNIENIEKTTKAINEDLKRSGFETTSVELYSTANTQAIFRNSIISTAKSKNNMFGIEVMSDGVFFVFLNPVIKDDNVIGIIQVKESIHTLKKDVENLNSEFAFILDKKMISQISIEHKSGRYKDMIKDFVLEQTFYDTKFAASIADMDPKVFDLMLEQNYIIDGTFYRTYKKVADINGADIGLMIVGELNDKEGGFVNLADNMTKQVTTVALGLIISIILFMF